jgi:hypothetical protein
LSITFNVVDGTSSNAVPTADAGADQAITLPVNSLTLTGAGRDADGTITGYLWTKQSGPAATLTNANTASLSASGLVAGSYVFRLTVTDDKGATAFDELTVTVQAATATTGQALISFTLIDSYTDQDIRTLVSGETLNLAELPTQNLNIRANTNPTLVGSVTFALSGAAVKNTTETGSPYALYGDNNGNYNNWKPTLGAYTLVATPYTGSGGSGTAGTPLSITFNVVDGTSAARLATPAITWEPERFGSKLMPFPNPSFDGRFQVLLPEAVTGEIAYELVSASGARLTKGNLQLSKLESVLQFDFSRQMQHTGLYYLRLEGAQLKHRLKLMRQ